MITNKTCFHFVYIANVAKFCINIWVIVSPRCSQCFINTFYDDVFPVWWHSKDIQWCHFYIFLKVGNVEGFEFFK